MILQSEEFYTNPVATLTQVFEFLELSDFQLGDYRLYNGANYQPADRAVRGKLREYFQQFDRELAERANRKFSW